jgi:hypothetical protein
MELSIQHYEQDGYMFDVNYSKFLKITTPNGMIVSIGDGVTDLDCNIIDYGVYINYHDRYILLATYQENMGKYRYLALNDNINISSEYAGHINLEQLLDSTILLVEIPNIPKNIIFRTILSCDFDNHQNFDTEYDNFVIQYGPQHGIYVHNSNNNNNHNNNNNNNNDPNNPNNNNTNNNNNDPKLNGGKRRKTRKAKKSKKSKKSRRH